MYLNNFIQVSRDEFFKKIKEKEAFASLDNSYSINYYIKGEKKIIGYSMSLGFRTAYFINKYFYE